jgi:3-hydroxyisobutyrate dehydrogenase-like beta-hydroxyacid dehydrogenase|tara:strand:- start:4020 stop:4889 length:870 start_codon:yes stop_codon:yes gene_type:complete
MKTKGFIGLGVMGFPMAGHIAKNYPTAVYNRSRPKSDDWMKVHTGRISLSPEDLGSSCNEIFMCIGNDNDVREVISGDKGILKSMSAGGIIVDHTTTSAVLSIEMSKLCMEKGVHYLDAPVSGGQAGAENGSLTIMVGGHSDAYEQAKVTMNFYSKFSKLMGPSGSGQLTKMVNQICIAGLVQGLAEGINFSEKAGLATKDVIEVISQGAAQSWQMENRWETMSLDDYDHGFAVDHMRKDLKIAIEEAEKKGALIEITKLIDGFYKDIQDMGGNRWDTSSLLKRLQEND